MHTFLLVVWFLIPAFFFLMTLWAKLEQLSGKGKQASAGDFLKQGFFTLGCVLAAIFIDQLVLEKLVNALSPDWIPLGFYEAILLPLILLIAAKVVGPSKTIQISKAPHPSQKKPRGK